MPSHREPRSSVGTDNSTQNAPTTTVVYDSLGRPIAKLTDSFDGSQYSAAQTQYGSDLRVQQVSEPYLSNAGPSAWTSFHYDGLNRVSEVDHPDGSWDTNTYSGPQTIVRTGITASFVGNPITTWRNRLGQKIEEKDVYTNATVYGYGPFGTLTSETGSDAASTVTSFAYSRYGWQTGKTDLNGQLWTATYDSFGEPLTVTTPNEAQNSWAPTAMEYDGLGRMIDRTEPDMASTWQWDNGAGGPGVCFGQLGSAAAAAGVSGNATVPGGYSRTHTYDGNCRPSSVSVSFGSNSLGSTSFAYQEKTELPLSMTYPDALMVTAHYNGQGYQDIVYGTAPGASQSPLYTVANRDDGWLHPTSTSTADGVATNQGYWPTTGRIKTIAAQTSAGVALQSMTYTWDPLGNLIERQDTVNQLDETYTYDRLNELRTVYNGTTQTLGVSYVQNQVGTGPDGTYRINAKWNVGTYSYNTTGSSPAPYQLASVANGNFSGAFTYDADGNSLSDESGRSYVWTSFDMPGDLADPNGASPYNPKGGVTTGNVSMYFYYDPEHRRIQQGTLGTTTCFNTCVTAHNPTVNYFWVGDRYFEQLAPTAWNLAGIWRDYVFGPDGLVATYYNGSFYYVHGDHQSSVNVVTGASAGMPESDCYEAWGQRRFCNGTPDPTHTITAGPEISRGYTGQEMLDSIGLIHLNARLYDPVLGRFVSQDPIGLAGGQNPYAYAGNNPMSRSDPTGLGWLRDLLNGIGSLFDGLFGGGGSTGNTDVFQFTATVPVGTQTISSNCGPGCTVIKAAYTGNYSAATPGSNPYNITPLSVVSTQLRGADSAGAAANSAQNASQQAASVINSSRASQPKGDESDLETVTVTAKSSGPESKYRLFLVAEQTDWIHGRHFSGHTFLGGIESNGYLEAYGYYPKGTFPKRQITSLFGGQGAIQNDVQSFEEALAGQPGYAIKEYDVTAAAYDAAMDYMIDYDTWNRYDLWYNSCVTAAFRSLNVAGATNLWIPNMGMVEPNFVYDAIKARY